MFFYEQDRRILEQREKLLQMKQTKANLAKVSGIHDDALLEKLIELEIGPETLATLIGIPLIEVAWADGEMDEKERKKLFEYAEKAGLRQKGLDPKIMSAWLKKKPDPALLTAWTALHPDALQGTERPRAEGAPRRSDGRCPLGRRGCGWHPRTRPRSPPRRRPCCRGSTRPSGRSQPHHLGRTTRVGDG